MIWNYGDIYEGHWMNNKRSGKGRYISRFGEVYKGEWKNDSHFGFGVFTR